MALRACLTYVPMMYVSVMYCTCDGDVGGDGARIALLVMMMIWTFATDVVSGREKNWAETENKLTEEPRLKHFISILFWKI